MHKPSVAGVDTSASTEDQVAEYLVAHPDFFERHTGLLARLRLPHQRGSAAVSLVERQVLVLREQHAALDRKLRELIDNARSNETIVERTHRLTRRLLKARDFAGVVNGLEVSLREDFGASSWVAVITDPSLTAAGAFQSAHVRVVPRGSPELKVFETFFDSGRPRSGHMRDAQREYLFGAGAGPIGSAVLIPLGERSSVGLIAIASHDTERFLPTMSTDFLGRIGEVISEALLSRGA
jgi:uncharacterized protein YigA (DUF484 family)